MKSSINKSNRIIHSAVGEASSIIDVQESGKLLYELHSENTDEVMANTKGVMEENQELTLMNLLSEIKIGWQGFSPAQQDKAERTR